MAGYDEMVENAIAQIKQEKANRWLRDNPTTPRGVVTSPNRITNLGVGSQPSLPPSQPATDMVDVPDYATLPEALSGVGVRPDTIQTLTNPSKDMVLDTAGLPVDWKTRVSNVYDYNKANDVISNWGITKKILRGLPTEQPEENNGVVEVLKGGVYTDRPEWHTTPGGVERGLTGEVLRVATQQGDVEGTEKATNALKNIAESGLTTEKTKAYPTESEANVASNNAKALEDIVNAKKLGLETEFLPAKTKSEIYKNYQAGKGVGVVKPNRATYYYPDGRVAGVYNINNQMDRNTIRDYNLSPKGHSDNVSSVTTDAKLANALSNIFNKYPEDYTSGLADAMFYNKYSKDNELKWDKNDEKWKVIPKIKKMQVKTTADNPLTTYGQLWDDVSNVKTSSAGVKLLKEKYGYSEQQAKQIINQGIKSGRIK